MKQRIFTKLAFLLFCLSFWQISNAQSADPDLTGAVFVPDSVSIGEISQLQISFSNSGFSEIPPNSIQLTISIPDEFYMSDGVTAPSGAGGDLFAWTYLEADVWQGTNMTAIPMFGGGLVTLDVMGVAESSTYEVTNINVQPFANFNAFADQIANNNKQPSLLIGQGCPDPADDDGDGLTNCEEINGIDDPSTIAVPSGISSPLDPCDPNPTAVATGDCDKDGNPNSTDPNPTEAIAVDDTTNTMPLVEVTVNVLGNDDFVEDTLITRIDTVSGGTAMGTIVVDTTNLTISYTPLESEVGDTVTIDYIACNSTVIPEVCDTATMRIAVVQGFTIGDMVFMDVNSNGLNDGEPGIDGVTVNLYRDGAQVATTTTSGGGLYSFDLLEMGMYYVEFVLPGNDNEGFTIPKAGSETVDSDVDGSFGIGTTGEFFLDNDTLDIDAGILECEEFGCKGSVNLSIAENCTGLLTPSMLLANDPQFDDSLYTIVVVDEYGNVKEDSLFTLDDVGATFEVSIFNTVCNIDCWLDVNVEYKYDPVIECFDDTLSCTQAFDDAIIPDASANCATVEVVLVSERIDMISCDDDYIGSMTREYVAIDEFGNSSDTCPQTILLERTNLDSISFPQPWLKATGNPIICSQNIPMVDGNPAPSYTGVPRLRLDDGSFIDLLPFDAATICNGYVDYEDEDLPGATSCKRIVKRTFYVGEWWCNSTNEEMGVQLIEIIDTTGPQITGLTNLDLSTSGFSCEAITALPIPTLTDDCQSEEIIFSVAYDNGFIEEYNGELVNLPVGNSTVTYTATDACGNSSTATIDVLVTDFADPIAVCEEFTTIGISLDTLTHITAVAVDNGSFDECGPVTLEIARMLDNGSFGPFGPSTPINCADAGTEIMVGLMVTDAGGNTNMCMVTVEVQDKVEAIMVCPDDVTVECNFGFDPDNLDAFFGAPTIHDNCPGSNTVENNLVGALNDCGSGQLTREMTLFNAQGTQIDFCTQTITFEDSTPLTLSDITPPPSEVTVTGCGVESIDPDILGMPTVAPASCQQIGISIENDTFPFTQNGACLKIIRTFGVADWCIASGPGSVYEPYLFEQIIKVNNTVGPEFSNVPEDSTFCSFVEDCADHNISNYLMASVSDDCTATAEIATRFEVRDENDILVRSGLGLDANGTYDVGTYELTFIAEDLCGNQSITSMNFEVRSCKAPTAYCLDGLSTSLIEMDTTGDGLPDGVMVMLTPAFFDAGSYHACGNDITLSFSADLNDQQLVYNCDDLGEQEVELWVTDEFGNTSFCITTIDVQDNDEFCPYSRVAVEGRIYTEMDANVNATSVTLVSDEPLIDMTEESGEYAFPDMPTGGSYQVSPNKNDDHANGVNTLDLVMIQRHILEIEDLSSPYKLIAADINKNDNITVTDLLELRKLIMGIYDEFPNNTSWRFVDEAFEFENDNDPWTAPFPEVYDITGLENDMNIDFIAIKTGDVNGDVDVNLLANATSVSRSGNTFNLLMPDMMVEKGNIYEIEVTADELATFYGMQFTMEANGFDIIDIQGAAIDFKMENVTRRKDQIVSSFAVGEGQSVQSDDVLFTMTIAARTDGQLSEMISMNDEFLRSEAYVDDLTNISNLDISWRIDEQSMMEKFAVEQVSPNPWNARTTLRFTLPQDGEVTLRLFDNIGRLLHKKTSYFSAGNQEMIINRDDVQYQGLINYELQYGTEIFKDKMIRID